MGPYVGTNTLYGGVGNDTIEGDTDNDRLDGESGDDVLFGWFGNDTMFGGTGNDQLWGEDNNDNLSGGDARTGWCSSRVAATFRSRTCLPCEDYRTALSVSAAHVYLTYPFVLSWSMLEAMAVGCLVIGSDTPPVREVIADGENGRLVDFFAPGHLADRVVEALSEPAAFRPLREAARRTVIERYDLPDCLARQRALLREMTGLTA